MFYHKEQFELNCLPHIQTPEVEWTLQGRHFAGHHYAVNGKCRFSLMYAWCADSDLTMKYYGSQEHINYILLDDVIFSARKFIIWLTGSTGSRDFVFSSNYANYTFIAYECWCWVLSSANANEKQNKRNKTKQNKNKTKQKKTRISAAEKFKKYFENLNNKR